MRYRGGVCGLAVSRDGELIASGDNNGDLIAWHGATASGEFLNQVMEAHSNWIEALDFSPGGTALATSASSQDRTAMEHGIMAGTRKSNYHHMMTKINVGLLEIVISYS